MAWTLGMRAAGVAGGIALASVVWPIAGQQDVDVAPVAVVASAPAHMTFNPGARLDTSSIDDTRRALKPVALHCTRGFVVATRATVSGPVDDITCASEAQADAQNGA